MHHVPSSGREEDGARGTGTPSRGKARTGWTVPTNCQPCVHLIARKTSHPSFPDAQRLHTPLRLDRSLERVEPRAVEVAQPPVRRVVDADLELVRRLLFPERGDEVFAQPSGDGLEVLVGHDAHGDVRLDRCGDDGRICGKKYTLSA